MGICCQDTVPNLRVLHGDGDRKALHGTCRDARASRPPPWGDRAFDEAHRTAGTRRLAEGWTLPPGTLACIHPRLRRGAPSSASRPLASAHRPAGMAGSGRHALDPGVASRQGIVFLGKELRHLDGPSGHRGLSHREDIPPPSCLRDNVSNLFPQANLCIGSGGLAAPRVTPERRQHAISRLRTGRISAKEQLVA